MCLRVWVPVAVSLLLLWPAPVLASVVASGAKLNASIPVFAAYLNVTPVTVRSWEKRRRSPSGPALRLLQIAKKQPEVLLACA